MYAMLSLDLDKNTTTKQRNDFNASLKKAQWIKIAKITTTWYAKFKADATESGMIAATKTDVTNAAKAAGITSYDAVVHAGSSKPTSF